MYIVWYTPANHPDIITDATLIDGDGELLIIDSGWRLKIICVSQVVEIISSHQYEGNELFDIEVAEYEGIEDSI